MILKLLKIKLIKLVEGLLTEINQALIKDEEIRLPGHFSLKTTMTSPRMAMNLQTKKKMTVPAKRVPKIRFSPELKKRIAETKIKR